MDILVVRPLAIASASPVWVTMSIFWNIMIALGVIIAAVLGYFLLLRKQPSAPPDSQKTRELLQILGGRQNIQQVALEGTRLRVTLASLKACDYADLKRFGATGIFVAGKQIKFILKDATPELIKAIQEQLKEEDR